jgi:hypothetical protein
VKAAGPFQIWSQVTMIWEETKALQRQAGESSVQEHEFSIVGQLVVVMNGTQSARVPEAPPRFVRRQYVSPGWQISMPASGTLPRVPTHGKPTPPDPPFPPTPATPPV